MRKDIRECFRDWQVLTGFLVLPVITSFVLPLIIGFSCKAPAEEVRLPSKLEFMLEHGNISAICRLLGVEGNLSINQVAAIYSVRSVLTPVLALMPIFLPIVIAADSFAGEKERKTLEPLLAAPISDLELILGKVLASLVPSLIVSFASFAVASLVVNLMLWDLFHCFFYPDATSLTIMLFFSPAAALLSISVTVLVSSRVRGFREAQQLSALALIPLVFFIFASQIALLTILEPLTAVAFSLLLFSADVFLLYFSKEAFSREKIIERI